MFRHEPLWLMIGEFAIVRRGNRMGFQDENAQPFYCALNTIKEMTPRVFCLECVEAVANSATNKEGENDLAHIENEIEKHLGSRYTAITLRHRCPTRLGFPMLRPRFYIVGLFDCPRNKNDFKEEFDDIFNRIQEACGPVADYLTFLDVRTENLGPYLLLEMVNLVFDGGVE